MVLRHTILVSALVACSAGPGVRVSDTAATTEHVGMFRVYTHSLFLECRGEGAPTVVFDSGAGNTGTEWDSVARAVSRTSRVCTYDRAGLGRSEKSPHQPTASQRAGELHALLEAANVPRPLILVGHSAGGMIALAYVMAYPSEVAGIGLIDSSPISALGLLRDRLRPDQWFAFSRLIAEPKEGWTAEGLLSSEAELSRKPLKLDIPVIVASRGKPLQSPPPTLWPAELGNPWDQIEAAWQQGQRDLINISTRARQVVASKSGHYIHRSEPDLVIGIVAELIDMVRRS